LQDAPLAVLLCRDGPAGNQLAHDPAHRPIVGPEPLCQLLVGAVVRHPGLAHGMHVSPNSQLHRRPCPDLRQDVVGYLGVIHACMKSSMIFRTTSDGVRLLNFAKRAREAFVSGVTRTAKMVFLSFFLMAER